MRTEYLKAEAHQESRTLWEAVFPEDSPAFLDVYYSGKGLENAVSVIRTGTEIGAMMHWNPRTLCCCGAAVRVDFIVAVATKKELRRRGLMAQLMKDGLRQRASEGMPFVFLTPANEAYYTPFGFVTVGQCMSCRLDLWCASDAALEKSGYGGEKGWNGEGLRIDLLSEAEYGDAARWANAQLAAQYAYYVQRNAAYFRQLSAELASEGGAIMAVRGENTYKGIFLYTAEGGLELREAIYALHEEKEVLEAICKWAREREVSAGVSLLACRPTLPGAERVSVTMIRITSIVRCASLLKSKERLQQYICVEDAMIEENNGCFLLSLSPDGCSMTSVDMSDADRDCLQYTIEELTALLFSNVYLNEIV